MKKGAIDDGVVAEGGKCRRGGPRGVVEGGSAGTWREGEPRRRRRWRANAPWRGGGCRRRRAKRRAGGRAVFAGPNLRKRDDDVVRRCPGLPGRPSPPFFPRTRRRGPLFPGGGLGGGRLENTPRRGGKKGGDGAEDDPGVGTPVFL